VRLMGVCSGVCLQQRWKKQLPGML
jgi:hypothetical protein